MHSQYPQEAIRKMVVALPSDAILDDALAGHPVHRRGNIEKRIVLQLRALNDLEGRLLAEVEAAESLRPMIRANISRGIAASVQTFRARMLTALNPHAKPAETKLWKLFRKITR